ncbi:MAG: hypothetical protein E6G91_21460, partial [Alphaproteobacteria bacterium]
RQRRPAHLPMRFVTAMRTGVRFARESAELKATLVRAAAFLLFASAYLALLPLIARDQLSNTLHRAEGSLATFPTTFLGSSTMSPS